MHISTLLPELSIADCRPKIRNSRQYVLSLFVEQLKDVKDKKGKPFTVAFYAYKLSHLSIDQLYDFYKICSESNSGFCKCFFGALRTDKKPVDKRLTFNKRKSYNISTTK